MVSSSSLYHGIREELDASSQGMKEKSVTLLEEVLVTPTRGAKDFILVNQLPVVGSMGGREQRPPDSLSSFSLQDKREELTPQTNELAAPKRKETVTILEDSINISSDSSGLHDELHSLDGSEQVPDSRSCEGGKRSSASATTASPEVLCTPTCGVKDSTPVSKADSDFKLLTPDDINFPKLQTPTSGTQRTSVKQNKDSESKSKEPQFVWKTQQVANLLTKKHTGESGKVKDRFSESTPLTRQGYRSGRLAEDFWTVIGMPNTPAAKSKMLRVIPFLTKNREKDTAEYLVDKKGQSFGPIAHVHIAEVLAGIPWTQSRAKSHVVNEVSLALHKILIFNNNFSNPFQRWNQGQWYAQWGQGTEGELICTLYVSIDVPEQKVKPRKGHNMCWRKEPLEVSKTRTSQLTEGIHLIDAEQPFWQLMAGTLPNLKAIEQSPPEFHNRFASLLEDEAATVQ